MRNLIWFRKVSICTTRDPCKKTWQCLDFVNIEQIHPRTVYSLFSGAKSDGSKSFVKLDSSESVNDMAKPDQIMHFLKKLVNSKSCAKFSEPTGFAKLDAHFNTVQLFELSSSAKPDSSKSSSHHGRFPNRPASHSFFKKWIIWSGFAIQRSFLNGPASRRCTKPDGSKSFVKLGGSKSANDVRALSNHPVSLSFSCKSEGFYPVSQWMNFFAKRSKNVSFERFPQCDFHCPTFLG